MPESSGRGAIKAGSGYIDVHARLNVESMARLRSTFLKEMGAIGKAGARDLSKAMAQGLDGVTKSVSTASRRAAGEVAKQTKKAAESTQKTATDSAKRLNLIERDITKYHGEQAGQRFRSFQKLHADKLKMEEGASKATRRAISDVAKFERKAINDSIAEYKRKQTEKAKQERQAQAETRRRIAAEKKEELALSREVRAVQREVAAEAKKQVEARSRAQREALAETRRRVAAEKKEERALAAEVAAVQREITQARKQAAREQNADARAAQQETRRRIAAEKAEERALAAEVRQVQRQLREEIRETARAQKEAERARIAALRQAQQQELALLSELRRARQNDLRNQLQANGQLRTALQSQLREQQNSLRQLQRTSTSSWTTFQTNWRRGSQELEHLGTSAYEAGNLVSSHLLAPLAAVSGMLTTIGVKSADSFKTMELGLRGMKVNQQDINKLMKDMQSYAVATPYSLEDMQSYSTRFARVFSSHDPRTQSKDPKKKAAGSKATAQKTEDIIKAVGDNAAASGILDPDMVSRGLYALTIMGDTDRVNMRQLKQFESATGMPAEELATMMGFEKDKKHKTAFASMAADMQDPKRSGGVSGVEFIDKIIGHWKGSDRQGAAATLTEGTISGRLQALQEKAKLGAGRLFVKQGEGDEESRYTELGQRLMGDGGLLDRFEDIAKGMEPFAGDVLKTFFDVVENLTGWLEDSTEWLDEHPAIKDMVLEAAKIAAVAAPFLLGFGLLAKVVGKLGKTFGLLLGPAKLAGSVLTGIGKGGRGITRTAAQVGSGIRSRRAGNGFLSGYDSRRDRYRATDERRSRGRERFRNASREQGRIRTARQYARYGAARVMRRPDAQSLRPQDNRDRGDAAQRNIDNLQRQIHQAEEAGQQLQRQLREVNGTNLADIQAALGGSGRSVEASAGQAGRAVSQIGTEFRQLDNPVTGLRDRIQSVSHEITQLNDRKLTALRITIDGAEGSAQDLHSKISQAASEMGTLDRKSLSALREQFSTTEKLVSKLEAAVHAVASAVTKAANKKLSALRSEVTTTTTKVKELNGSVGTLNRRSLSSVTGQFGKLKSAVSEVYTKVGTSKGSGSLSGRITLLNDRKLTGIKGQVEKLASALKSAAREGKNLQESIDSVNESTGNGGGKGGSSKSSKKRRKKFATGGVLPGYQPGVDSIPAMLSPGEAILRPEVAHHLGEDQIDAWNAAAARGHLSRFARGTSGAGKFGGKGLSLGMITETMKTFDLSRIIKLFGSTVKFDSQAARVGGGTGTSLVQWGTTRGGETAGSAAAVKLRGELDFVTKHIPDLFKKAPTGVSQLAGILAGAIAPTAGDLFWKDIWKGRGNILQRTGKFTSDLLNPSTVWEMLKDGASGVWDSVKAIVGSLNPLSGITDAVTELVPMVTELTGSVANTFTGIQEIISNPSEYATDTLSAFWSQAKEAMPNTEGLLQFADGGVVPGYSPDNDRVKALLSPGEAVLRPEAVRQLGYQTIMDLNRGAKTGQSITDKASGKSSLIIPSPDSATFNTEVKKIEAGLDGAGRAVQQHKSSSNAAWTTTSSNVKNSVDGKIRPALQRWQSALSGPLTSSEKGFQSTNNSVWSQVSSKVSSSNSSAQRSFSSMKSGLKSLEGGFNSSQKNIGTSMGKIPTAVTKHVRSAVSFIQRAMISPVNDKLLGPAKIGKIGDLPRYATGGVVPGYSPGNDSVMALLSPGESILRPEVTRALGKETIHALNGAAMKGKLPAFATGGIIGDWGKAENSAPGEFEPLANKVIGKSMTSFLAGAKKLSWLGGIMEAGAKKAKSGVLGYLAIKDAQFGFGGASAASALAWARTQAGKPYQWGGNGDPSWDCSGLMSAIESVIRGEKPHRRWATGAFHGNTGPAGWVRNLKSPFQIGITNAGVGHTAGTLNGVNVESRGGDGVLVGKRARGANDGLFTSRWGFKGAISSGSGSGRWAETVSAVLRELGWFSSSNLANVLKAIQKESGGNPNAVNNWDSNARSGNSSRGLLQTIPSTFAAYAGKYRSRGITDPFANIYAASRYAHSRYGEDWAARMARPGGYWMGTHSASPGLRMVGENGRELVDFRGGERVYNSRDTEALLGGKKYEITINEAKHETTPQAVMRAIQFAEAMYSKL
ncbi:transglycosylase SLT domain-containing protein [Streptomyces decoyicus]